LFDLTGDTSVSIQEGLTRYTDPERLKADERPFCSKCQQRAEAIKQNSFTALPPVLCLHLKRFQQTAQGVMKIDHPVRCPLKGLSMAPYMHANASRRRDPVEWQGSPPLTAKAAEGRLSYSLFAIVEHIGTMDTGHYIAFVRRRGRWYRADDQMIAAVSDSEVEARKGYMMFYVRDDATL